MLLNYGVFVFSEDDSLYYVKVEIECIYNKCMNRHGRNSKSTTHSFKGMTEK